MHTYLLKKKLCNLNFQPLVAKRTRIPIPIELIAVAAGTTVSYLARFEQTFNVNIIGDIPTG